MLLNGRPLNFIIQGAYNYLAFQHPNKPSKADIQWYQLKHPIPNIPRTSTLIVLLPDSQKAPPPDIQYVIYKMPYDGPLYIHQINIVFFEYRRPFSTIAIIHSSPPVEALAWMLPYTITNSFRLKYEQPWYNPLVMPFTKLLYTTIGP